MPEVETGLEDDDLWLDVEKAIEAAGENDDDDEENRRGGNGPSGD
jgi:hypothetical protein